MGILDGFFSLGSRINKVKGDTEQEVQVGAVSDYLETLDLGMKDEELIELTDNWKKSWDSSAVKKEWLNKCEENENYWLGKQFGRIETQAQRPLVDNMIFESLEIFLPQATKNNPEATVELRSKEDEKNPEFLKLTDVVKDRLNDLADELKLRLKIKRSARHWAIYLVGMIKLGWSMDKNDITIKVIRPKKLILDPEGVVDEDGYSGEFMGEIRKLKASILYELADSNKDYIKEVAKDKMGTDIQFIEWWTDEYMCWTLDKKVLKKKKNPNWNYDTEVQDTQVDEFGDETPTSKLVPGINHFSTPQKPYIPLSVFNLGKQPVDDTSLISQNLSNQDLVNTNLKQIVKNVKSMNGGLIVSKEKSGLDDEQAGLATEALRNGGTIVIPTGVPRDAVERFQIGGLPSDVYNFQSDVRGRMMSTFGVKGLSPAGVTGQKTVRSQILMQNMDASRVGGEITDYLEQFADDIFNMAYQLMLVYYPEFQGIQMPRMVISVKDGSLLPKDTVSEATQAIQLAESGKMSLIDLYTKLEYPNPEETAANVWLETNAPQILYAKDPRVQQVMQMQQVAAQAQAQQMTQETQAKDQQTKAQMEQKDNHKMFDHESKMQQLDAKQQGDLLKKVPVH